MTFIYYVPFLLLNMEIYYQFRGTYHIIINGTNNQVRGFNTGPLELIFIPDFETCYKEIAGMFLSNKLLELIADKEMVEVKNIEVLTVQGWKSDNKEGPYNPIL